MTAVQCSYLTPLRASVEKLAELAFAEDCPAGDVTAIALDLAARDARAELICREEIRFCGHVWLDVLVEGWRRFSGDGELTWAVAPADGTRVPAGSTLLTLRGSVASIVGLERTLLNFLGRAIGIATATSRFVDAVAAAGGDAAILDTRKTLPGYRWFDKYAVLCGGGRNHRLNLSDQVLIKENHIAEFDGVAAVLSHVRERLQNDTPIQIEVTNLAELQSAIDARCPIIMIDNFTPDQVREAVRIPRHGCELEVSGGVTLDNISDYALPGLDRISIGAITHSVKAPDLSLLIREEA